MRPAHTEEIRADLVFIHNGAPPALVGSQAGCHTKNLILTPGLVRGCRRMIQGAGAIVRAGASFDKLRTRGGAAGLAVTFDLQAP